MVCSWVFIFVGVLTIVLCVPLVLGKIKPNPWYGIRFPASYQSEENWYRINRTGGWIAIVWGAVVTGIGIGLSILGERLGIHPLIDIVSIVPLVIVLVVILAIYASRYDK